MKVLELRKCVREYLKPSILAPVFVSLEVVLEVIIPYLLALLIDSGINSGDFARINELGIFLVIASIMSLFCGAMSGKYAAVASAGFATNIRNDLYHKIQEFSFANIDKFSTSSLITRMTTDINNIQHAYQMLIRIAVRAPIMIVFSFIMANRINSRVSLIFLGVIPVLGGGLYFLMSRAHIHFKKLFKTYDKLNSDVEENINSVRVVKDYVREDFEIGKFKGISAEIFNEFSAAQKILAANSPLMSTCMYATILLIAWFSSKLIYAGDMTTGELMSFISYASQILMSLMMFSMVFVMMVISKESVSRVVEVLSEEPAIKSPDNGETEIADGSVEFKNMSFSYTGDIDKLCLSGINLKIPSGSTLGILGATGSGKTSLVQLIPRLFDTTDGKVLVGGKDVREYNLTALRSAVSMVLQKNVLFSGTIRSNLQWGKKDASDEELDNACRIAQADGFVKKMPKGYDSPIEQGGTNVSGGQRQRLCIARAIVGQPKILILDDSTSAVDTATDKLIREAFRSELPEVTKIIIAQRVASVMELDQIAVMENGRIVACGTHSQLMNRCEIYRDIFETQMRGKAEAENE